MRLKTYRASTMADALSQVKKDLGKDAVILHTRAYKHGAIFGFGGKPTVEITASIDVNTPPRASSQVSTPPARAAPPAPPGSSLGGGSRLQPSLIGRAYGVGPSSPPTAAASPQEASRTPVQVYAGPKLPGPESALAPPGALTNASGGRDSGAGEVASAELRAELAAIKRMVGQVLQSSPGAGATGLAAPPMPQALVSHYMMLIQADVAREIADSISAAVRDELTPQELADAGVVRQAMIRHIEALLPETDAPLPARTGGAGDDGRPLTIALIGPTGVGKTTTVAKLAAAYKLRHGKKVGLITADTYRIAAVEQLRTYANIIGLPLKVVMTPAEMTAACQELSDMDVVLIDTAGRSPSDSPRLAELAEFLAAARPHQRHMVLSSVLGDAAMARAVERFRTLHPDHLIFTKLDEAASYGVLLNIAGRLEARLSYVTTGQEVPDDIEPTRTDRLARLILDGAVRP
ncbi:MAG: flagellar biosynthesis protein FlhF [Phycisphaerales bacterium]|nr:flagellar biosynthesis protein FlhF [Phycisphaerales bacterium]